jgi:outer membrane protein assembly factor BamB
MTPAYVPAPAAAPTAGGTVGGYVFISGKSGIGYVVRAGHLGGIGGQIARLTVCAGFGTGAVYGSTVYVPCHDGGIRAVTIGSGGIPQVTWTARANAAQGSPVTGGGAVWVVDYQGGILYALDPSSGVIRGSVAVGQAPHFSAPALSGGRAYVGTLGGVVSVNGA